MLLRLPLRLPRHSWYHNLLAVYPHPAAASNVERCQARIPSLFAQPLNGFVATLLGFQLLCSLHSFERHPPQGTSTPTLCDRYAIDTRKSIMCARYIVDTRVLSRRVTHSISACLSCLLAT